MGGGHVLVVDDDPVLADMVIRYLRCDGYVVQWLTDGRLVTQAVAEVPPDLLVLDLLLPGRHGREVCRDLRRISDVPILMLTALGEQAERLAGLEAGADDYLAKPFSPRELVLRVRAILRRTQSADRDKKKVPSCATVICSWTRAPGLSADAASRCCWEPGSVTCCCSSCATPERCSPDSNSWSTCGAGPTATSQQSRCMCDGCGKRLRATQVNLSGCLRSGAPGTATSPPSRDRVVGRAAYGGHRRHSHRGRARRRDVVHAAPSFHHDRPHRYRADRRRRPHHRVLTSTATALRGEQLRDLLLAMSVAVVLSLLISVVLAKFILIASVQIRRAVHLLDENQVPRLSDPPTAELRGVAAELRATQQRLADAPARETAAENSRRHLLRWIGHDLRTPLSRLRAMVEGLQDEVLAEPEVAQYHGAIRRQTDRLPRWSMTCSSSPRSMPERSSRSSPRSPSMT